MQLEWQTVQSVRCFAQITRDHLLLGTRVRGHSTRVPNLNQKRLRAWRLTVVQCTYTYGMANDTSTANYVYMIILIRIINCNYYIVHIMNVN